MGSRLAALDPQAVDRLLEAKGRRAGHPLTLAIRSVDEALDYVPDISPLAHRLARRCWPGPVTLVLDDSHPESLVQQLPEPVRRAVSPEKSVGLRVPGHSILLDVLEMVAGPLVLTSANKSGGAEARTALEALEALRNEVELVLDDGPTRYGQPSSVVRVTGGQYEILRVGAVPEKTLRRLTSLMILFVCTGNTCRSPMAEMICRKMLARRLGCELHEVEDRGVIIMSAGIAAMTGGRAAAEAVQVMASMELDLSMHETQPLTEPLVRHADLILTMTQSQRKAVVTQWPSAAARASDRRGRWGYFRSHWRAAGAVPALRRTDREGIDLSTGRVGRRTEEYLEPIPEPLEVLRFSGRTEPQRQFRDRFLAGEANSGLLSAT